MSSPRPPCQLSEIPKLVLELYGLQVTVLRELAGYDDRNILVKVDQSTAPTALPCQSDITPEVLVKITNQVDSSRPEQSDMRNTLILHLKKAGFPTPGPLITLKGTYQSLVELTNTETDERAKYIFRLFQFIPGKTLHSVRLTKSMCREVGRLGGWLDEIWTKFPVQSHEGIERLDNEVWSMSQVPNLRSKLDFVTERDKVAVIEAVISEFETKVLKSADKLSKGFIHADLNDANILVTNVVTGNGNGGDDVLNGLSEEDYMVSGVIDFGDISYSLHILEPAIAICYIMINKSGLDPIESASLILSGYLQRMPLARHELALLRISTCARLVQSFVNGQVAKATDEGNEHSQFHAVRTWPALETLLELSDDEFLQKLLVS